ncbi:carotenoid biosynthesis protein [Actinokineospora auranticolor]|uniref:Putative membrane protein n=1 Tax=Actinokineospora auranticolor TaxID=155976 RepID=A0A2S6GLP0_9PSEU|nr:carotenoid biosynthesis protein [Actinokineospora auranticolor]PPK66148.1 putative membrane protein [Actinokineospora auranticolor]
MSSTPAVVLGRARVVAVTAWVCGAVLVLAQISYSMTDPGARFGTTVASVVAFALASLCDAAARSGPRAALRLALVAGGGGLLAEAVGVHTGFPFGEYRYTGTLGPQLLGVPVLVPLAWIMMCWPALLVGRALAAGRARWAVVVVGAWALASWDVFLDPQMVDAGHWVWTRPEPVLPGVVGVPLTNYAGWFAVALVMVGLLHRWTPPDSSPLDFCAGPAPALYLWTYGSSVWAHAAFFGRPSVSLVAGVLMGLVAVPFAVVLLRVLVRGRR